MNTGLSDVDIKNIQSIFGRHKNINKVILYGSRASGTHKPASDIDLTLVGNDIFLTQLNEIENQLDELNLPYKFDISIHNQIDNDDLLQHIKRVGKVFYSSN